MKKTSVIKSEIATAIMRIGFSQALTLNIQKNLHACSKCGCKYKNKF